MKVMKADDAELLVLLKKTTQFQVPIYQRVYSWTESECRRLWNDILTAGAHDPASSHFTGSIVYIEREAGTRTATQPDLIIDGQQRLTTVMLLLAALAAHLESKPEEQREPVEGFSPDKIRWTYLKNHLESDDRRFKLILSKTDEEAFKTVLDDSTERPDQNSRVWTNFRFFESKLASPDVDVEALCRGLMSLVIVDVSLRRGVDDPQLVFETMNSTGRKLSQADLIRNFVLMDLEPEQQADLYRTYWRPMERLFTGPHEAKFDEFVRHYLTLKTGSIPKVNEIYDAFKAHTHREEGIGHDRQHTARDLYKYAEWFSAMALGKEENPLLRGAFHNLEQLRATVVYPFLLRVYADYHASTLSAAQFRTILDGVTAYIFRRAVCQIPPNSLNTTFANLTDAINPEDYVDSIMARLQLGANYRRFPTDAEFKDALRSMDFYHFKRAHYFFRKLENHGRKEAVSTSDYTIEHILPQNKNLSSEWREALGPDWATVQEENLHKLGNLTLTGYNSEYSDRPFTEKREMEGGFKDSPLRLNRGLALLPTWNAETIDSRGLELAEMATKIWARPFLEPSKLERYRDRFGSRDGFDWNLAHEILAAFPAESWTSYSALAEAIGTSPQPLATHISQCTECTAPYRVLTHEGRVAMRFAWSDSTDRRDPQEVLESEGVRFTNGEADLGQKLQPEDLLALVES